MNHRLMRRNIDSTVFLRAGQAEHMIVFVNRPAYRAQTVVTIRQDIGDRKFLQSRRPCRLNDSNEGYVMGGELIEPDLKLLHIAGGIMSGQNPVCHRILCGLLLRYGNSLSGRRRSVIFNNLMSIPYKDAVFI